MIARMRRLQVAVQLDWPRRESHCVNARDPPRELRDRVQRSAAVPPCRQRHVDLALRQGLRERCPPQLLRARLERLLQLDLQRVRRRTGCFALFDR
jgi:hypothetical protein